MDSITLQYIIIAVILLVAAYYLYKVFRKNFSLNKFKKKDSGCDQDCGCS